MNIEKELQPLQKVLKKLRDEGKILIALLYGSYAKGRQHTRSDIDLAVFVRAKDEQEAMGIFDEILMSVERDVSILRLDDENESPFVIQEALKGQHMVDMDTDTFYDIADRMLHETEEIRFRRALKRNNSPVFKYKLA